MGRARLNPAGPSHPLPHQPGELPKNTHISFTERRNPRLRLRGSPSIPLQGSIRPPEVRQPVRASVTIKGKRLDVRLSRRHERPETQDPSWPAIPSRQAWDWP